MPTAALTVAAVAAALRDPEWCEAPVTDAISPLTRVELTPRLVVDIPATVPRLFVGVNGHDEAPPFLDLIVDSEDELNAVARACDANPNAVIALAQLLRATDGLDIASSVVAESLAYSMLLGGGEFASWLSTRRPVSTRSSAEPIVVSDDGTNITIALNRPEVHNAYDSRMRDALVDALRAVSALGPARAVLLVGNGPSFCSGGDLGEFGTMHDLARAHVIRSARSPGLLLDALGQHAVARVHGVCIGAGIEVPAFCNRVEAHVDTVFQLPEISMGLIPGAGGTASITRRVGRQRTAWLAISGTPIDARTAWRWGLVDGVYDT